MIINIYKKKLTYVREILIPEYYIMIINIYKKELTYPIYQPLRSGRIWHKVNF